MRGSFDRKRDEIESNFERYHSASYRAETFDGPELYFHKKCLSASHSGNCYEFSEYLYALLPTWGMHRMGTRGPKVQSFDRVQQSLRAAWDRAIELRKKAPGQLKESDWSLFSKIFHELDIMKGDSVLVGHSKVLAHLMPTLVPPVDRSYSLAFLFNSRVVPQTKQAQWEKLRDMLENFYYPILEGTEFITKNKLWKEGKPFLWDTSPLKIIDNLIIGRAQSQNINGRFLHQEG